jgi:hypothetical protein
MDNWVSTEQASKFLGRRPNTIIAWCKTGKIVGAVSKPFGIRTRWIIPSDSLIAVSEQVKGLRVRRITVS